MSYIVLCVILKLLTVTYYCTITNIKFYHYSILYLFTKPYDYLSKYFSNFNSDKACAYNNTYRLILNSEQIDECFGFIIMSCCFCLSNSNSVF